MSLADTVKEALRLRDKMREDGASAKECAYGLEMAVRASWPKGRDWKFLCDECSDTGFIEMHCRPGRRCEGVSSRTDGPKEPPGKYRRLCALNPASDYEHSYMQPCFCAAGDRHRVQPVHADTAMDRAAMTPKHPTKFGR